MKILLTVSALAVALAAAPLSAAAAPVVRASRLRSSFQPWHGGERHACLARRDDGDHDFWRPSPRGDFIGPVGPLVGEAAEPGPEAAPSPLFLSAPVFVNVTFAPGGRAGAGSDRRTEDHRDRPQRAAARTFAARHLRRLIGARASGVSIDFAGAGDYRTGARARLLEAALLLCRLSRGEAGRLKPAGCKLQRSRPRGSSAQSRDEHGKQNDVRSHSHRRQTVQGRRRQYDHGDVARRATPGRP